MDAQTLLIRALAAGAAAMFRPNLVDVPDFQKEIEPAYLNLKEMIQERYAQVNVDLLDVGPASAERQQRLGQQLQAAGVTEDRAILRQAQAVLDTIGEEYPSALSASEVVDSHSHLQ